MRGILADGNVKGQVRALVRILEGNEWQEVWASLQIKVVSFADLGLADDASDRDICNSCQQQQVVLVTANRNADGNDSLEATIRDSNAAGCLPVLTIANVRELESNREYPARVAQQLLDVLFDIEEYGGVGRLFLP